MASNVEIKVACANLELARSRALAVGAVPHAVEQQTDRYFEIDGARRVKLRSFGGGRAELIEYDRPEVGGVRVSRYRVTPVRSEAGACAVPSGPPLVTVTKRREILLIDNVRIHLDTVVGLGTYLELARISHQPSTASADGYAPQGRTPSPVLNILSSMPPGASVRATLRHTPLHTLATKPGEICGLEAVADEDHDESRCRAQVSELMQTLGVEATELVRGSYSDLLLARRGGRSSS